MTDKGERTKLCRAGYRMSKDIDEPTKVPLWVTVNAADREPSEEYDEDDDDSDEDVSEGEVDRALKKALKHDYQIIHEHKHVDLEDSAKYSGDTESLSGN
ncbi:uncharacterized protein N7484_004370 [Penicillium longicatenatum]|uniref:uncharacterized protein n=1 Tax=Penicillium longicatenatum TaxID=1561947 RepID=UPI00254957AD|nr:uncharacterized protein N7484_004370 [Penicillium longicatenatum]KAJ5650647.1 hypothetical protein N7484_004370 [Penicillium longicatenatum]